MGKLHFFFSVSNDELGTVPLHTGDEFGILLRQKKMQRSLPERQTDEKKSMSTTVQTYWQSSAEIWECQRNYSLKNEVDKDAISCFSIRRDWRFAVRAKSFALHWRSRGFFFGVTCAVVRKVYTKAWWEIVDRPKNGPALVRSPRSFEM